MAERTEKLETVGLGVRACMSQRPWLILYLMTASDLFPRALLSFRQESVHLKQALSHMTRRKLLPGLHKLVLLGKI